MDCQHGHHHAHHHHHHDGVAEGLSRSHIHQLRLVFGLSLAYLLLQFLGGYFSGSLALMAEAGHKLGDASAIALALVAAWFATRPVTERTTFGYGRMEILAALLNGMILVIVAGTILVEAVERLSGMQHHHAIHGELMFGVAAIGFLINIVSAKILHPSTGTNLNIKGAYLHVMTDLAGSIGTMISAVCILLFQWQWLDLLLSGMIALFVLSNAIRILSQAIHILMEASPLHVDLHALETFMLNLPGVRSVHDIHVWTITTGKEALLAHVVVAPESFQNQTVAHIETTLREAYGFCHITIQLEPVGFEEKAIPF